MNPLRHTQHPPTQPLTVRASILCRSSVTPSVVPTESLQVLCRTTTHPRHLLSGRCQQSATPSSDTTLKLCSVHLLVVELEPYNHESTATNATSSPSVHRSFVIHLSLICRLFCCRFFVAPAAIMQLLCRLTPSPHHPLHDRRQQSVTPFGVRFSSRFSNLASGAENEQKNHEFPQDAILTPEARPSDLPKMHK